VVSAVGFVHANRLVLDDAVGLPDETIPLLDAIAVTTAMSFPETETLFDLNDSSVDGRLL
jgi:hypothetical protein